ncbi:MAG: HNH endonuclease [Planctomycetota bacterium]|nr:HNH endonuclease [Planctomycetota bacterium]
MEIFAKILQSQESGYSGSRPNQRGKYILVPQECWPFFPDLKEERFNDFKTIVLVLASGDRYAVNYHFNNAKYHLDHLPGHTRDHNEKRIYRNNAIDRALELDRQVIVVLAKHNDLDTSYLSCSVSPSHRDYTAIKSKLGKKNFYYGDETFLESTEAYDFIYRKGIQSESSYSQVLNFEEHQQASIDLAKNIVARNNEGKEIARGDPSAPLKSMFKTQQDFTKSVRDLYGNQCSIRRCALVDGTAIGLEAAHIMPDSAGGPLLPTNGILLSVDLHRAFDYGYFTLDTENRVEIWHSVPKSSELWRFNHIEVSPRSEDGKLFAPYSDYKIWHRDNVFGRQASL